MITKAGPTGPCVVKFGRRIASIPALFHLLQDSAGLAGSLKLASFLAGGLYWAKLGLFFFVPAWLDGCLVFKMGQLNRGSLFLISCQKWANINMAQNSPFFLKSGPH